MSDPYNWSFPQRNETMFMATIGRTSLTKKIASSIKGPSASPPFKRQTYPELNPNAKSPSLSIETISPTLPTSNPSLKATS